jgi:hypothetical protein
MLLKTCLLQQLIFQVSLKVVVGEVFRADPARLGVKVVAAFAGSLPGMAQLGVPEGSFSNDVMILKIFSPKNWRKIGVLKILDHNISF